MLSDAGLGELLMELSTEPEWVSVFPHGARVVCGGLRQPGTEDTTPDPAVTERILRRCVRAVPALAGAQVLATPVGLRPERPSVRVEAQRLGSALVVHDYGHGGNGVSLSWGCAARVRELVETATAADEPGRAAQGRSPCHPYGVLPYCDLHQGVTSPWN